MKNPKPIDFRRAQLARKLSDLLATWPKDPLSAEVLKHVKRRTKAVLEGVKRRKV